ncbi:transcriptional regulator [Streptomyces sp. V2]|uniref:Helix-turn-helix domain-containing protein n=1 Tax=Streptomyces niveiscabiei TaxID=164115 RepID=A0ABW9I5B3_9ACTN|nr:helix-turn-helix domain-containing protein [Streptomyces sp. V2]PWG11555.1 transcriptional regulator [Streptomyces sp. V2]
MDSDDSQGRVLDPTRDAAALKALTHPLRIQLLGLLRQFGPATASELAARTGESSASASYHLRVLAKYAFITEAEHRDSRERRWKAVHRVTSWDNAAMEKDPVGQEFVGIARRLQADHLAAAARRYESDLAAGLLDEEWVRAAGISDALIRLTPESLLELTELFDTKIEELRRRDTGDARARQVVLFLAGLPQGDAGGDARGDADGDAQGDAGGAPDGDRHGDPGGVQGNTRDAPHGDPHGIRDDT